MRKLILAAGTAALALSMPAVAEKGGHGGGGHGDGNPHAAAAHGGGGKPDKAGGGHSAKPHEAERQAFHAAKPQKAERQAFRADKPAKAERQAMRQEVKRQQGVERGRSDLRIVTTDVRALRDGDRRLAGFDQGCPPGLAKKHNGCLPPGQAKKRFAMGERVERSWFDDYRLPARYRSLYYDTPDSYFRYDDSGYIYRVNSQTNLISGLIPLFGGGFAVGQPLPAGYDVYNVPYQYRDDYRDTDDYSYRYGDDAIYRVDNQSGIIEGIVALLAGDLNVGQPLPSGYDAYNLPLSYRDRYADNDDYLYRYGDGNIYQVDAKTQIIQAIVQMLT